MSYIHVLPGRKVTYAKQLYQVQGRPAVQPLPIVISLCLIPFGNALQEETDISWPHTCRIRLSTPSLRNHSEKSFFALISSYPQKFLFNQVKSACSVVKISLCILISNMIKSQEKRGNTVGPPYLGFLHPWIQLQDRKY